MNPLSFKPSAFSLQPISFHLMFSILQAFKPPVSSPPVLQSSSTRSSNVLLRILQYPSIRGIEISRSYRATPPRQKSLQSPQHWGLLPVLGVYFQRPLSHSVRWGSIFSDPYRILCFGVSKTHGKVLRCDFLRHLAPHVGHLARLVGHLGANMSHKCSQDARKMPSWSQHRQKSASATSSSTPKYQKTNVFQRFLQVFCYPAHVPK